MSRWRGRISSRMALIDSNPSGMPGTSGNRTSTTPGVSVSLTPALGPQPFRLSLIAVKVKLSPPIAQQGGQRRPPPLQAGGYRLSGQQCLDGLQPRPSAVADPASPAVPPPWRPPPHPAPSPGPPAHRHWRCPPTHRYAGPGSSLRYAP